MRMLLALLISCMALKSPGTPELDTIRNNYRVAAEDKAACREMINMLKQSDDVVHIAYLGAFQAIWAKHTSNPLKKLGTFKKGKKNIERAVAMAPGNAEIRFIRLSVQMNAPGFLGYSSNIGEDRKFIRANRNNVRSEVLKMMMDEVIE